jgi:hypothetical protein
MALNVGDDVSFDNTYDWKGILEKAVEVKSNKTHKRNDETTA